MFGAAPFQSRNKLAFFFLFFFFSFAPVMLLSRYKVHGWGRKPHILGKEVQPVVVVVVAI